MTIAATAFAGATWMVLDANFAPMQSASPVARDDQAERPAELADAAGVQSLSMIELLGMAQDVLGNMETGLSDYTARFVKQERDRTGSLGQEIEIRLKTQTRFRNQSSDAPRRIYLRFERPAAVKGREVIWGQDIYDGKMAVREVGMILGLKTIWLDPTGFIAMQGERYPISEIGLVKLVEKLIERGQQDRDNPNVRVTVRRDHLLDETPTHLFQVRRAKPSGDDEDFSLAEIVFDPERQLILRYRSYGWPEKKGEQAPLLEAYTYHDVLTNVGLTEADFLITNPQYNFPRF